MKGCRDTIFRDAPLLSCHSRISMTKPPLSLDNLHKENRNQGLSQLILQVSVGTPKPGCSRFGDEATFPKVLSSFSFFQFSLKIKLK